ncbi:MAG: aspartyl/asparaginyl beta-hydroxylase domain-containing protein [Pseudomonadota bacterium]
MTLAEAEQIARAGAAAMQAGDMLGAKNQFERLTVSGRTNAQIWLMLAHCSRAVGDWATAERAADAILAKDNHNLRALIIKGDARDATGDRRSAASFYETVNRLAVQATAPPPDLTAELERVARVSQDMRDGFADALKQRLAAAGVAAQSSRFDESVDILFEKKRVYRQEPTAYFFPQLPQRQFFERDEFGWVQAVEEAADDILAELQTAMTGGDLFRPYLESRQDRPSYDFHGLLDNPAWSTLYLTENGGPVERHAGHFPKTLAAMQHVPLPHITVRAPSILYSLLKGGARIAPHHGMINTRLICHLPLIVPPGCGFRVGNEVREWEVGKLMIFDDTIEHEAWNDSDRDRIILIFDVWRPELTMDERAAVTAMFEAIDT